MKRRKTLRELTIKDSFMFGAVMIDEENCRGFLELALDFPIEKVTVSREKSLVYHSGYKGVRLDVVAKDEKKTRYNIEMQISVKPALGKRTRYYHSQLDMEMLGSGQPYEELPDAYVIFICDYDPFGERKYCYSWDTMCHEDSELQLYDGRHTIIFSTCGENDKDVPEELVRFLKFVGAGLDESTGDYGDGYVRRLQNSVDHIKTSREMEARYMLWEELINEEREDARAEGRAEGRAEERINMTLEILLELCDEVPADIQEYLRRETDLNVLTEYFRVARKVSSIEEFKQVLFKI